ncbi:hypothetical protein MIAR_09220 [Microbacterium arabinogalactanolyticum]|nr:hypothetical protein MIAR_09220 [Microbacterium arabinogalactanolyticum]
MPVLPVAEKTVDETVRDHARTHHEHIRGGTELVGHRTLFHASKLWSPCFTNRPIRVTRVEQFAHKRVTMV